MGYPIEIFTIRDDEKVVLKEVDECTVLDSSLFLSPDQIYHDLLTNRLDSETLATLKEDGNDIANIRIKIELARWIRNSYGLWLDDNPYTMKRLTLLEPFEMPNSEYHPDQVSGEIMDRLKVQC